MTTRLTDLSSDLLHKISREIPFNSQASLSQVERQLSQMDLIDYKGAIAQQDAVHQAELRRATRSGVIGLLKIKMRVKYKDKFEVEYRGSDYLVHTRLDEDDWYQIPLRRRLIQSDVHGEASKTIFDDCFSLEDVTEEVIWRGGRARNSYYYTPNFRFDVAISFVGIPDGELMVKDSDHDRQLEEGLVSGVVSTIGPYPLDPFNQSPRIFFQIKINQSQGGCVSLPETIVGGVQFCNDSGMFLDYKDWKNLYHEANQAAREAAGEADADRIFNGIQEEAGDVPWND